MVLDGTESVHVTTDPRSAPLVVEIDGRTTRDMAPPVAVEIRTARGKARLVRTRPRTFYGDLARR